MVHYNKLRKTYIVYTLGGYIELKDKAMAKQLAKELKQQPYLASVQGGYLPASLRRAGTA